MIKVGIIGGTGYTGLELLRILANHPEVEVCQVTSRSEEGRHIRDFFPSLPTKFDFYFTLPNIDALRQCDVIFSAAPNGVAMKHARELIQAGVKVIDLSADFRIKDVAVWSKWYGMQHACPELIEQAVYGLPEVNREAIRSAQLVANPGCYPTSVQLGFLPLIENDRVDNTRLIADAKSGVSGAGRKSELGIIYSEVADSFKAYAASGHRHLAEIVQELKQMSNNPETLNLTFTPHLVPMIRGIHATLYAELKTDNNSNNLEEIQSLYHKRYADEPFVEVMPLGSHPDTRNVRGTNLCRIALHKPTHGQTLVILVVEDNLVKGAAGQAIQNMNLLCGFDETTALLNVALVP